MPTTTIQIIGIFLLSYQIAPGGGLVAVAPRMPCPSDEIRYPPVSAEYAMNAAGVEPHEALLVFSNYKSVNGWTPVKLQALDGMWYVKLDGEKIRFITNSSSGPDSSNATARTGFARGTVTSLPVDTTRQPPAGDLGLPHAGGCCASPKLRPEYTPATDYRLAAAVLDFSSGRGTGCHVESGRQDTLIQLENDGTLIVEGTKGKTKRTITFDGAEPLFFFNVPVDATGGKPACKMTKSHFRAYAAMLLPCEPIDPCPKRSSSTATQCNQINLLMPNPDGSKTVHPVPPILPQHRLTAECSNNQWP